MRRKKKAGKRDTLTQNFYCPNSCVINNCTIFRKYIYIFKISVKTATIVYRKNKQTNKQTKKTDKNGVDRE